MRIVDDICAYGTKKALEMHGVNLWEFYAYLREYPDAADKYASAQAARAEGLVDEIIDISDTEPDAQRARNRIDARKWYASKMMPSKYGERIDVSVNQTVDIRAALTEARERLLHTRFIAPVVDAQVIETTKQLPTQTPDGISGASDACINSLDDLL